VSEPFRRAVFFIAGFDPNGAQYLYRLFRRELRRDNALYGRTTHHRRDGLAGWRIETADAGRPVTVDYTVLSPRASRPACPGQRSRADSISLFRGARSANFRGFSSALPAAFPQPQNRLTKQLI
jgi:hypothetical protein